MTIGRWTTSFWFFLFLFSLAGPGYAQNGEIIKSIKIEGNKRIESSTILFYIKSEVDQPLSQRQIRRDIEQIFNLGQFKDIQVESRKTLQGLELVFIVEEIPSIGQVSVIGNQVVESSEILDLINIKRGATFSDHLVQESIENITQAYHDKGYFFVNVRVEAQLNQENLTDVNIRINEGRKVNIEKIRFSGNKTFRDKELRKQMETKEKGLLSFLDESGIYKKDQLKLDLLRVESFYHDHGFLRVRILEPEIEINQKKKEIYITIPVEEGAQFRVEKIEVAGDDSLTQEDINKSIKSKAKEIYNESQIRNDVLSLTEIYSQKGYAYADVNPKIEIKDKTRLVAVTMEIERGRKVYVGEINIAGNLKTRDNVIRREFRMKEGELFNSEKLRRSKQRINNLNFFEDVKIDTRRGTEPDLIDIDTTITERPTGSFSIGAGFSSVENLIFNASIAQDNLFGRGQKLAFQTNISSRRTNFNISFTDPRVLDSNISGGIDLFSRQNNFFSFDTETKGWGLRTGTTLGEYDWLGINYQFDDIEVSNVPESESNDFLKNETRTTSRIAPTFIRDTRDDFMNPTTGWRHVVRLTLAGGILGGSDFYKTGYEVTYYHPLIGKLVGAVHGAINIAAGYGGENLPVFERYFMGGPSSLRGFTIRDVGPKNANGDPLGGDQSLLFNFEIQYPFTKTFRGFVFYDRGNVYGSGFDIRTTKKTIDFGEMRSAIGAGIRFLSPFGPIGFSYGIKVDKQGDEKAGEFQFSAGSAF